MYLKWSPEPEKPSSNGYQASLAGLSFIVQVRHVSPHADDFVMHTSGQSTRVFKTFDDADFAAFDAAEDLYNTMEDELDQARVRHAQGKK